MDGVQQDLERLEVTDWEERIQDRDYWRSAVTAAAKKPLQSCEGTKEEEE